MSSRCDFLDMKKVMKEYLAGTIKHYKVTYRLLHKDGNWRWFINRGGVLKDIEGNTVSLGGNNC